MRPNSTLGKVRLEVRLSPKLRERIINAAAQENMSISEYCTMILSNTETSTTLLKIHQSNKRIEELYYKVGNNVNQLARLCNGLKTSASPKQIYHILTALRDEAQSLKEDVTNAHTETN